MLKKYTPVLILYVHPHITYRKTNYNTLAVNSPYITNLHYTCVNDTYI